MLADRVELQNVKARFPSPDFTGHYRYAQKWGYVQIGGALRYIAYDDTLTTDQFDLSGHVWGWGLSVSSALKPTPNDTLHLQVIEGAGVENYFNDAPVDVGDQEQSQRRDAGRRPGAQRLRPGHLPRSQLEYRVEPSVGYSRVDISNSDLPGANAYKNGQYASVQPARPRRRRT